MGRRKRELLAVLAVGTIARDVHACACWGAARRSSGESEGSLMDAGRRAAPNPKDGEDKA